MNGETRVRKGKKKKKTKDFVSFVLSQLRLETIDSSSLFEKKIGSVLEPDDPRWRWIWKEKSNKTMILARKSLTEEWLVLVNNLMKKKKKQLGAAVILRMKEKQLMGNDLESRKWKQSI